MQQFGTAVIPDFVHSDTAAQAWDLKQQREHFGYRFTLLLLLSTLFRQPRPFKVRRGSAPA
jgi:hypothetical protein